jgi:hypothetical protein
MVLRRCIPHLFHYAQLPKANRFEHCLNNLKATQLAKLSSYKISSLEKLKNLPITSYGDYPSFEQKAPVEGLVRYEPTSGSTAHRKWFPYTKRLLNEFDNASSPWIYDLIKQYPAIKAGRQYWSLSWIPNELREQGLKNDDSELLPWWKTLMVRSLLINARGVEILPSLEEYKLQTTLNLIKSRDLSLLSVWSPTFLLSLMNDITELRAELAKEAPALRGWDGQWTTEITQLLWPNLTLISSWDQGHAAPFAKKIAKLFHHATLQGKGIWTTEGVISIPYKGHYPLALNSHFYEFECTQSGQILNSWELERGMVVHPILTTGGELYRYKIHDRLLVSNYLLQTPCFSFQGREYTVDITGEKLDFALVSNIFEEIEAQFKIQPLTLFIDRSNSELGYSLIITEDPSNIDEIQVFLERALLKGHHYQVARSLGQLNHAKVEKVPSAQQFIEKLTRKKGILAGEFKLDPISFI